MAAASAADRSPDLKGHPEQFRNLYVSMDVQSSRISNKQCPKRNPFIAFNDPEDDDVDLAEDDAADDHDQGEPPKCVRRYIVYGTHMCYAMARMTGS